MAGGVILEPPKRPRWRPYALLTPSGRTLRVQTFDVDHVYEQPRDIALALERLQGHMVYAPGKLRDFLYVTPATDWCMTTWRSRPVSMTHKPSGVSITSLRNALNESPTPFAALVETLEWLRGYGVAPGTTSSMAWNLLRASLHEKVSLSFDPQISRAAFYGGRQEIWEPNVYNDMKAIDVKAAYPFAMASEPIALSLREVSPTSELTTEPGIACAEVFVPLELPYAPLPVRVAPRAIQFQYHEVKGFWSWRELLAAKDLGCIVRVKKSYAPRRTYDLFGPWWTMAQSGRALSPGAADLAKMITNASWGQFAMEGQNKVELHFTGRGDLDYVDVEVEGRQLPQRFAKHVAVEITSRVREKTLREGLYGSAAMVVHVDTDGIIAHASSPLPPNSGEGFGQWRVKETFEEVEIRAPQLYRYRHGRDPAWHYVAAGMSLDGAAKEFKRRRREKTKVSYLSEEDVNLPSARSHDVEARESSLEEMERWAS